MGRSVSYLSREAPGSRPPRGGRDDRLTLSGGRAKDLLLVLLVCVALRAWVIVRTEVVADDSTYYVRAAQQIERSGLAAFPSIRMSPGFPAAMVGMRRLLLGLGISPGPTSWDLAGQVVAAVFAVLATGIAWWFGSIALGPRVATLGILVFTVTREWTTVGSDALSDTMAVGLQMVAVVVALLAERRLGTRVVAAAALAGAAGVAAGAAYMVRAEGIVVLPAAGVLLLAGPLRGRSRWRATLLAIVSMTVGAAMFAGPYAAYVGAFTLEHDLADLLLGFATGEPRLLATSIIQSGSILLIVEKFVGSLHAVMTILISVWGMTWFCQRVIRLRLPRRVCVFPRTGPATVTIALVAVYLILISMRQARWGDISSRYFMLPSLMLAPLGGAGLTILAEWIRLLSRRCGSRGRWFRRAYWNGVQLMVVALVIHAGRPLHPQFANTRQAGEYVCWISSPAARVLTNDHRAFRYAQRDGRVMVQQNFFRPEIFARLYNESEEIYVVARVETEYRLAMNRLRREMGLALLQCFPSSDPERMVYVFSSLAASPSK